MWPKQKRQAIHYTLENNIEDIEALRKYLGFNKICVLGVSYGGMVAQGYAIRYNKHVDKLILVSTAPSYHFIENAKQNLKKIGTKQQISVCDKHLWSGSFKNNREVNNYFKIMDPLYIYNYKNKKRRKVSSKKIKSSSNIKNILSHDVLNVGFSSFLHEFNFIPKLRNIKCPTLVLSGKNDWVCVPEHSKIMADNIPNSTLKVFNKCGHALTSDANNKYIKSIKQFLENTRGGK